ncbi:hypothetical protein ABBQ38_003949 [Trebouxia sp. C0009 RCD-2024]
MTTEICLHGQACSAAVRGAARRPVSVPRTWRCGHSVHRHVLVALHLRQRNRKRAASCITRCLQSTTAELEDIDPLTGAVLTPVKSKVPKESVTVNGIRWAYRTNTEEPKDLDKDKRPVLLLHGLGSASFSYRETCELLGKEGFRAVAVDWPGHGASDKPDPSQFDYSKKAYIQALDALVSQLEHLNQPVDVIVQGFILGQYALLWAMQNPDKVEKLVILNTPLGLKTKLRPELAAYKNRMAFLRPDPKKKRFDGAMYNAAGSSYQMQWNIAEGYNIAYQEDDLGSIAVAESMNQVDFPSLLAEVNEACRSWRKPSLLLFGQNDPFIPITTVFDFLEDKRTNFELAQLSTRMGHMPQEDYAEAIQKTISNFLRGIKE